MKNLLSIIGFLVFSSLILTAQSTNFIIEDNSLFFENGFVAGRNADGSIDNRDQLTVWAGFINETDLSIFETGINNYINEGSVATLNETLGNADIVNWNAVPVGTGVLASSRDYSLNDLEGNFGDSAILLVSTSSSFSNLTPGDEIGLVTSSATVPEFGSITVGFETLDSWDTSYLGTLGSLTFVTVVPEPSTYALFVGILAIGYIAVVRRRRS